MLFTKSDSLTSPFPSLRAFHCARRSENEDAVLPGASGISGDPQPRRKSADLPRRLRGGFSLVEMLVVMAIMTILTGITVPAVKGLASSSALNTGARKFADLLYLARSEAISRHTIVRVAVATQWAGQDDAALRKVSLWSWDPEAQQYFQTTNWENLPAGVIVESSLPDYVRGASYATNDGSSVRGDCVLDASFASQAEFTSTVAGAAVTMRYVEFLPTGGAQIPGGVSRNAIFVLTPGFLNADGTLTHTAQANGQAVNWAQINVDTLTGRVRVYQP